MPNDMGRRTLLLIASILIAALGTSLIWLYVQGADIRSQQGSDLVQALFLTRDAPAGTDAATLGLTKKLVPASVAATAVTDPSALVGQRLKAPAFADQMLVPGMLGKERTGRFPQQGAVAISISEPNRVPADLTVGDVVDVYALGGKGKGSQVVARCLTVRSIGPLPGTPAPAAGGAVSGAVIGFDANQSTANDLYAMVGADAQPALYDHNPNVGC